ncbi:unnamed protein product [Parajaminaea phylloscopi]
MASSCCLKVGSISSSKPKGTYTELSGLKTYVTGNTSSKSAILFIADVMGINLPNNRVLADKYAEATGAAVYLPDYFNGEDFTAQGVLEGKEVDLGAFLGKYPPRDPAIKKSTEIAGELKKKHSKLGAVGFCWGAPSVLHLGSSNVAADSAADAIAFAHPSALEVKDFETVTKPGLFICPEHDPMFPEKEKRLPAWEVAKAKLAPSKVFTAFVFTAGLSHGYATKGDDKDEFINTAMEHAAAQVIAHFGLFL